MLIVEVELPIKGSKEEIDKMLLKNGFEEFYKVLTISTYYKLKEDKDLTETDLKEVVNTLEQNMNLNLRSDAFIFKASC